MKKTTSKTKTSIKSKSKKVSSKKKADTKTKVAVKTKTVKAVKKKKEEEEVKAEILSTDPEVLLGDRRHPRGWKLMNYEQKLDYIASRILAEDRHGVTSHKELKESGILSTSQYERRRNREVYSQVGDLDSIKVKEGVFSRTHVRDIRGVRKPPKAKVEDNTDE